LQEAVLYRILQAEEGLISHLRLNQIRMGPGQPLTGTGTLISLGLRAGKA